jgi:hypothetical protein
MKCAQTSTDFRAQWTQKLAKVRKRATSDRLTFTFGIPQRNCTSKARKKKRGNNRGTRWALGLRNRKAFVALINRRWILSRASARLEWQSVSGFEDFRLRSSIVSRSWAASSRVSLEIRAARVRKLRRAIFCGSQGDFFVRIVAGSRSLIAIEPRLEQRKLPQLRGQQSTKTFSQVDPASQLNINAPFIIKGPTARSNNHRWAAYRRWPRSEENSLKSKWSPLHHEALFFLFWVSSRSRTRSGSQNRVACIAKSLHQLIESRRSSRRRSLKSRARNCCLQLH